MRRVASCMSAGAGTKEAPGVVNAVAVGREDVGGVDAVLLVDEDGEGIVIRDSRPRR